MLPKLINDGERVIIASQSTVVLDLIQKLCRFLNLSFARIDGQTEYTKRHKTELSFGLGTSTLLDGATSPIEGSKKATLPSVLLLSGAGGLGLNLQGASSMILLTPDWNPSTEIQFIRRIDRSGQCRTVNIFRLIMGDSLEEKIFAIQANKLKTMHQLELVSQDVLLPINVSWLLGKWNRPMQPPKQRNDINDVYSSSGRFDQQSTSSSDMDVFVKLEMTAKQVGGQEGFLKKARLRQMTNRLLVPVIRASTKRRRTFVAIQNSPIYWILLRRRQARGETQQRISEMQENYLIELLLKERITSMQKLLCSDVMKRFHRIDGLALETANTEWHSLFGTTNSVKKELKATLKKYRKKCLTLRPTTVMQWKFIEILNEKAFKMDNSLKLLRLQVRRLRAHDSIDRMTKQIINASTNTSIQPVMVLVGLCPIWQTDSVGNRVEKVVSFVDGLSNSGDLLNTHKKQPTTIKTSSIIQDVCSETKCKCVVVNAFDIPFEINNHNFLGRKMLNLLMDEIGEQEDLFQMIGDRVVKMVARVKQSDQQRIVVVTMNTHLHNCIKKSLPSINVRPPVRIPHIGWLKDNNEQENVVAKLISEFE